MNSADLREPGPLLLLLQVALATGLLAACEYDHPWVERRLTAVRTPGIVARPGQALGPEACLKLCGASEVEQTCNVATLEIAPNPGARVRCADGSHVLLAPELHSLAEFGEKETALKPEQCRKLCAASASDPVASCVIGPVPHREALKPGAAVGKDELFVLCNTHYPGGWDVDIVGPLPSGRVSPQLPRFHDTARSEAEYFSRSAYYEAASVGAFRRLRRTLVELGAPAAFAARARDFAVDEARHCRGWLALLSPRERAEASRAIARRGLVPQQRTRRRSKVLELAHQNLHEGCVGESYGTWIALHQAGHADRSELRHLAHGIARDEAAHAALAFQIHAWLWPQLARDEQRVLRRSAARAIGRLARPLPVEAGVARRVGAPAPSVLGASIAPLQALLRRALLAPV